MKVGTPSNSSKLRFSITVVIVLMVISSSSIIMFPNSVDVSAVSTGNANRVDSSSRYGFTSMMPEASSSSSPTPMVPATTTNHGNDDFTAQAPLLGPATFRSTDLVSSTAIYEIQFITTTTGVIDKIDITFPAGTVVAFVGIIERVGITGPGVITNSGTTVTLDLNTPVSVPAGTFVRLEMVDLINPPNQANYKISVTTRNPSNVPIDGPSLSPAYTIRQVSTGMIANGAITSTKPAESFMKRVTLIDDEAGHAKGWNPGSGASIFEIDEEAISSDVDNSFFTVEVRAPTNPFFGAGCVVLQHDPVGKRFWIECSIDGRLPEDGDELHYVVGNLPEHVICGPGICRQ